MNTSLKVTAVAATPIDDLVAEDAAYELEVFLHVTMQFDPQWALGASALLAAND